jgi:hypothetical protein
MFGITDPLIVEALALREGVIFANLRGFQNMVLEMDCLEVVNLWNTRHGSRTIVASIIQEIGELVLSFSSISIQHVMRFFSERSIKCWHSLMSRGKSHTHVARTKLHPETSTK